MDKDTKKQFELLNKRFDGMDKRLGGMDKRLGGMATKDDLKGFATKDDLKAAVAPLATKDSLHKLATAEEMKAGFGQLREELADKEDINKVYNAADAFFKQTLTYHQEMLALREQMQTVQLWIKTAAPKVGVEFKQ